MKERRTLFFSHHDLEESWLLRRGALIVALIALVARLAYYLEFSAKPYFGVPLLDSRWWWDEAQRLMTSGLPTSHAFFRPPLYTLLLAAAYTIIGRDATLLMPLVQLLVGVGFCVLLVFLGARVWNVAAGLAAGCLGALYAPLVFYEAELLSDSLTLFWCALMLLLFVRGLQTQRKRDFFAAGLSAGLAALTRANAFPLGLIFLVGLLFHWVRDKGEKAYLRFAATYGLPFLCLVLLPTMHNIRAKDPVLICGQGGINFYLGNNPDANGTNIIFPRLTEQGSRYRDTVEEYAVLGYYAQLYGFDQAMLRYAAGDRPTWSELDRYWYGRGLSFLVEQPQAAVQLFARKLVALFNNREIRNNRDFEFARQNESLVLRVLPFNFAIALALGAYGLTGWRRSGKPGAGWILLYLVMSALVVVTYFVAGRLRILVLPALFIFAGIGLERLFSLFVARRWREIVRALFIVLASGAASCYSWPQFDFRYSKEQLLGEGIAATAFPAGEWAMLGNACLEKGLADDALRYANRAVEADPTFAFGWLILGNAALAKGDNYAALEAYRKVLSLEPMSLRARNNLAVALENLGWYQHAAEVYLDVLRADPSDPRANANLSVLLYRSGDKSAARMFAQIALDSDPAVTPALGVTMLTNGNAITSSGMSAKELPKALLEELAKPLPVRIDLTSSRPLEAIVADVDKVNSASLSARDQTRPRGKPRR